LLKKEPPILQRDQGKGFVNACVRSVSSALPLDERQRSEIFAVQKQQIECDVDALAFAE
jgi:hypothetical protein